MVRPGHPAPRLTAHQKRMRRFEDELYVVLRCYQRGDYEATGGVAAGQLTVPLTTVLDAVTRAANEAFGKASA